MKRKLVFWTAFNSYRSVRAMRQVPPNSPHPVTSLEWTNRRIEMFNKFNLSSLLKQTYDDFFYIVLMDPTLKSMTDPLMPKIDDRIIYLYDNDEEWLEKLRQYDEIVYALIDSDDMYSLKAGEIMMNPDNKEWMTFKYGYAFNYLRGHLFLYDTIWNGPFFAHRLNPKNMTFFDRTKINPGHKIIAKFGPQELPPGNFCVLLHDKNTSSRPNMMCVSKTRADINILKDEFGYGVK